MTTTLDAFLEKYRKIRGHWVKTHRSGPTGIGKTLEDLLGIKENNIQGPDFKEYELKSSRKNSKSMLTLFTKSPKPRGSNRKLLDKYGYFKDNKKVLHTTLSTLRFTEIPSSYSLKIKSQSDKLFIVSKSFDENIYWEKNDIEKAFRKKYKDRFIYVIGEARGAKKNEEFSFKEAYLVTVIDFEEIYKMIECGKILIDIRIGSKSNGAPHDHGTGFRILPKEYAKVFKQVKIA